MSRHVKLYLLVGIVMTLMTGCWDRKEINDLAFVTGTAIDHAKKGYRISIQVALPSQMGGLGSSGGGGGTSGQKPWYIISGQGNTIRQANNMMQQQASRKLYFSHRRVLVLGEKLAKGGIKSFLDIFGRIPQNRLTAYVVVAKGDADKILSQDVPMERFPTEAIRELAVLSMKTPRIQKHLINTLIIPGKDPLLPALKLGTTKGKKGGEKTIVWDGLAVFRKDKLAGFLNIKQSQGLLVALNQSTKTEIEIQPPKGKGKIMIALHENKSKIRPVVKNGELEINIQIKALASVVENESNYWIHGQRSIENIERLVNQKMEQLVTESMKLLQKKYKSDAAGIGKIIHIHKPEQWRKVQDHWDEQYPQVKINVSSNIMIEHLGSTYKPLARKDGELVHD